MSGRRAKQLRKEAIASGDHFKTKRYFKPLMLPVKGVDTYFPRLQRRKILRMYMANLKKGRLNDRAS